MPRKIQTRMRCLRSIFKWDLVLNKDLEFDILIAGLRLRIQCLYSDTRRLCQAYIVENTDTVDDIIVITSADIEQERCRLLQKKNPGELLEASTPDKLEMLHLCRRIADLLPRYDRLLFHGSSLAVDGRGVLFTAKSGTGKSTHTRLWREQFGDRVKMVNDDKPFLHIGEHGVTVYGTPWRGKHGLGENISAPLEAIYFLNRGEKNRVETVSPRELYPVLLQQTYTPDDPRTMVHTLALVERLSRNVKLFKLYCNMDPQAAHVALEAIEN